MTIVNELDLFASNCPAIGSIICCDELDSGMFKRVDEFRSVVDSAPVSRPSLSDDAEVGDLVPSLPGSRELGDCYARSADGFVYFLDGLGLCITGVRISVGLDCCGLCAFFHALVDLRFVVSLEFCSDIDPAVKRHVQATCPPRLWYDDATVRDMDDPTVPNVDLYGAAFPCQSFSTLSLGRGLDDARGSVLYSCAVYIDRKRPKVFLLENVEGLLHHDGGKTFRIILDILQSIGSGAYVVKHHLLDAEHQGIPHHRPRVYILGLLRDASAADFEFPAFGSLRSIGVFPGSC